MMVSFPSKFCFMLDETPSACLKNTTFETCIEKNLRSLSLRSLATSRHVGQRDISDEVAEEQLLLKSLGDATTVLLAGNGSHRSILVCA
jgi:hypothetical protein